MGSQTLENAPRKILESPPLEEFKTELKTT